LKRRSESLKNSCTKTAGLKLILLVFLVFGITGCAPWAPIIPEPPLPEASELINQFHLDENLIKNFAARGRLKLNSPQANYRVDINLAAIRPDRFRLTAIDFFGRFVLTLVSNQQEIRFLDHRQAKIYKGPNNRKTLGRFLPLGFDVSEIITLFAGGVLLPPHRQASVSRIEPGLWRLSLEGVEKGTVERVYVDPLTRRVKRIEIQREGKSMIQVDYSDYHNLDDRWVPFFIRLTDKQRESELILEYKEMKLHLEFPERFFHLSTPPGVEVIDL